jgi:hypothetical protein
MHRRVVVVLLWLFAVSAFAQERYPAPRSAAYVVHPGLYQIQVGAYLDPANAERSFHILQQARFQPSYERYGDFIRVKVVGVAAPDMPAVLERLRCAGFREVIIRRETLGYYYYPGYYYYSGYYYPHYYYREYCRPGPPVGLQKF